MTLVNAFGSLALDATVQSILTELGQKLEPADLAALATAVKQDTGNAALASILLELTSKLEPADLAALATAARQDTGNATLVSILSALTSVAVTGPLTDTQLRATPVPVSGTVSVTEPVTVDGTVTAVGPLTDTQLRATSVDVNVANLTVPVAGPLTDTQLRASPVSVDDGHPDPLTNTELRATPVPVSVAAGTVSVTNIAALAVINALSVVSHDLAVSAYSGTTALTEDYLLTRLEAEFSTAQLRTITVRTISGVVLWQAASTSLDVAVTFDNPSFDASDNLIVAVTQTAGPCSMSLKLVVQAGSSMLGGNPSLGPSDERIGRVDLDIAAGPSGDAFGRLRVTSPYTLIDAQHQYNESPLFMATWAAGGSIAHLSNESGIQLTANGTSGNYCRWQSRRYMRYQPGKSQLIIMTGVLGAPTAGVRRRMGYFDNDDGLFLEQDGLNGLYLVRRTSTSGAPVDNRIAQVDWNGDKFDGTGPSGVVLDPTKMQLFMIDFEWLSIGRVRYWFDIGGRPWLAHQITLSNTITTPYMKTANLPVRYEIDNTSTIGVPAVMKAICQTVMTEGGQDQTGISHTASNGATAKTINAAAVPMLAVRKKLLFNGLVNRGLSRISELQILTDQEIFWELVLDPVLTGPAWTSLAPNSIVEQDTASTAMTGGEVIACGYVPGGSRGGVSQAEIELEQFILALSPDGTASSIVGLRAYRLSTNASAYGAMTVREEY